MGFPLKPLFANASKVMAGSAWISAVAFFQGVLVARTFGPTQYGIWGVVVAFCATTKAFMSFRTSEPLTKYFVQAKQKEDRAAMGRFVQMALGADFATSLITFAFVSSGAYLVAGTMGEGKEVVISILIFGASLLLGFPESTFFSVIRDARQFNLLALLPAIVSILQLAAIGSLCLAESLRISTLALVYLGTSLCQFAAYWIILQRKLKRLYGIDLIRFSFQGWVAGTEETRGFWKFMRTTYLASTASSLIKNGDVLLIGYFVPMAQVGYYKLARNMAAIVQSLAGSLGQVIYQDMNELIAKGRDRDLLPTIRKLMKMWVPVVIVTVVTAVVLSRPAIHVVFGSAYTTAYLPFRILMAGAAVAMVLFWVQPLVLSAGYQSFYLKSMLCSTALAAVAMWCLGKRYGLVGMASAYSLVWAFAHFALLYPLSRKSFRIG